MNFTIGAQAQPVVNAANNNRSTKATGLPNSAVANGSQFKMLDDLILSLDAQYDMLPNQAAWVSAALLLAGTWQLCANCQPDTAAKKLFRQMNFYRVQMGLGRATVPPVTFINNQVQSPGVIYTNGGINVGVYIFGLGVMTASAVFWAQIGAVMQNPFQYITPGDCDQNLQSGDIFDFFTIIVNAHYKGALRPTFDDFPVNFCTCGTDGTPGLKTTWNIAYQSV